MGINGLNEFEQVDRGLFKTPIIIYAVTFCENKLQKQDFAKIINHRCLAPCEIS